MRWTIWTNWWKKWKTLKIYLLRQNTEARTWSLNLTTWLTSWKTLLTLSRRLYGRMGNQRSLVRAVLVVAWYWVCCLPLDKCKACLEVIRSETILAGPHSYHQECFTCAHCHQALGDNFYCVDDKNYCEDHKEVTRDTWHVTHLTSALTNITFSPP